MRLMANDNEQQNVCAGTARAAKTKLCAAKKKMYNMYRQKAAFASRTKRKMYLYFVLQHYEA